MYLSKPQYKAIISINVGKADKVAPEIIEYLLENGQIFKTLIDYALTDEGRLSCAQMFHEYQLQESDTREGPAGKTDFYREKRTVFHADDDVTIPPKRKSFESTMNRKQKPDTKYKKQS